MIENQKNIWGKKLCELPNGKLCNACCTLPDIELEGNYVSVGKPAHSPCPYLASEGCGLQFKHKPGNCESWHCSQTDVTTKVDLIAQGLASGLVTEDEAADAAFKYLKGDLEEVKDEILSRASELAKVTYRRDLVTRDLDET